MSAQPQQEATVGDIMPWVKMTLDYTDKLAAAIPDELLDWRPTDPSGKFCFSLAEIAMHSADGRRMFARQLKGSDSEESYWSKDYPEDDGTWKFAAYGSKQAILDSLREAREELVEWLNMPASRLLDMTDGTRKSWDKARTEIEEKGGDVAGHERRGPANINRVLMACACHEAGHRGSLQTLLRQHGVNAGTE